MSVHLIFPALVHKNYQKTKGKKSKYMVQFINSWIQKITYMWRKWGATQNFCLTSIYELEKQLLKKLLNWAYKKCKNFNIYMLKKKRKKKNNWRYHHFAPVYLQSWWYDLQFLRYKVWQTEFGNYRSFFALPPTNNLKNQNF